MCTGGGWGNTCSNVFIGSATGDYSKTWQMLPAPYFGSIGSAGPDKDALCRLFDSAYSGCTGSGLSILTYPGN
ncbi:hypothetical protein BP5796_12458 [Coleophoma crateriformis]|uniref:Uncharacterized protein n=1 Tax=Coleophoma crateriformis TaxID=565419 RepID=A0A3D8Q7J1_9HELO|nr:hypothetical protein BP5796_12458 [Coleophoma crateriformis]